MLSISKEDVVETKRLFRDIDVSVAFLAPTKTGLEKSIMDATNGVRKFLKEEGFHDFDSQEQGVDNKINIPTKIIFNDQVLDTKASLYRPNTKKGDPRIWFSGLKNYAEPGDLLAIVSNGSELTVVNCSATDLSKLLTSSNRIFNELLSYSVTDLSQSASELLTMFKYLSSLGYVKTTRVGSTGIGKTYEDILGIGTNSSPNPDYKGIEIKSTRGEIDKGKIDLFSKVPNVITNWDLSRLKSSKEILFERGEYNKENQRMQLRHTIEAPKKNSYDLQLEVDFSKNLVYQNFVKDGEITNDVTWGFELLCKKLQKKHAETFWVSVKKRGKSKTPDEEFHYTHIKHTQKPDLDLFPFLIDKGIVTVDYTIREKPLGVGKDQGYKWKIKGQNIDDLFTWVKEYPLI